MLSRHSRSGHFPGLGFLTVSMLLFLYLPLVILVAFSFNSNRTVSVWEGFTLNWYTVAAENSDLLNAVLNSAIVATSSTFLSLCLAVPAALALTSGTLRKPATNLVVGVLSLPLLIPEIVIAVALLLLFTLSGFNAGMFTLLLGHTLFTFPFALLPILARAAGLDRSLKEAGLDLYASPLKVFWFITLPLLLPGIVSGGMLAFIVSFDNFIVSMMISSAGWTTLPLYIYGLVKTQITPEINAISTVILIGSFLALTACFVLTGGKMAGVSGREN